MEVYKIAMGGLIFFPFFLNLIHSLQKGRIVHEEKHRSGVGDECLYELMSGVV